VTYGKSRDAAAAFNQNRIAETQRMRRADLRGEVEAGIKRVGDLAARPQRFLSLRFAQFAESRPAAGAFPRHSRRRHDGG